MAKDLTVKALENLKPGTTRREVPDGHTRGLFFVLQPSGAASWALRYRFAGRPKKLTLGPYPAIDIKTARQRAAEAIQAVARGDDPGEAKQAAKAEARKAAEPQDKGFIESVTAQFIQRYAARNTKEKTCRETERILHREVLGAWRGRELASITRAEVHELLDGIVDRGATVQANRVLAALRRMCGWAVERGIIAASPCAGVRAPALEQNRDRVLSDEEIVKLWAALDKIGWPFGPGAKLLLLTGARREEVTSMTWSEIDLEARTWTIPKERAKNGVAHEVPLSDQAVQILKALPAVAHLKGAPAFVFTTTGKTAVSGWSRAKTQIDRELPAVPAWTLHDLRRTAASGMAGLGIAPHVVEAVLNHKSGSIKGVAAVYNRYNYKDEKRGALAAWGRKVEALTTGKAAGNVVELAAVRGA